MLFSSDRNHGSSSCRHARTAGAMVKASALRTASESA
jgi:hypothetical protein